MSLNINSSGASVEVWLSVPGTSTMLVKQADIYFAADSGTNNYTIIVNEGTQYQQIDGFGGSLTDASCWLLKNKLTDQKRAEVMQDLFGPSGINISLLRQPIGASDFSCEAWTFDDTTNNTDDDGSLSNFSLWREDAYIRPMLDMAYKVNPGRIKIFATPWSPPAWMRSNKGLYGNGGYLRAECYSLYADYFVKYVKQYEAKGTPVHAVTIQNEPQNPPAYPGMLMDIQNEIGFIKDYIGPKFQQNDINTKIICYDHNFDDKGTDFAANVLASGAYNYCAGSAWHPYGGGYEKMTEIHNRYPDKDVWLTEAGSGTWIGNGSDSEQFANQMCHTIRSPRNWSKSVVFWNIALDQNASPKLANVDELNRNRGFLTIRSDSTDSVTRNTSYYSMGHTSKFVDPGAYRIESNSFTDDIEDVAYKNPDGSKVVVLSNRTPNQKSVKVKWGSQSFTYTVPEKAAVTFKWRS